MCVGDNGMVYVGDNGKHRVQIFHADGILIALMAITHEREPSRIHCPWIFVLVVVFM